MTETEKTNLIRLADVAIIGPVMIYAGLGRQMPQALRDLLVLFGGLTIAYNGANLIASIRNKEPQS